jgi:Outer membrane protein beta-barrel domain
MNRLSVFIISAFALFLLSPAAQAQEKMKLKLQYNAAQPIGGMKNYLDKTSLNGWGASLDRTINANWHVGLQVGFQDYYKKLPRQLYVDGEQTVSAVQTRSIQVVPVQLYGSYYWGEEGKIRPYASLGAGGGFVRNDQYWGQFNSRDNGFVFTASPGAGVSIPVGRYKSSMVQFGIQYNYVTYRYNGVENLNSLQANAGIAFPLR